MARHCQDCDIDTSNVRCPRCGKPTNGPRPNQANESDPPAIMDAMVERASRPSLASLIKTGIQRGLITPVHDYLDRVSKKP